jgi:chemotaxis protein CheD
MREFDGARHSRTKFADTGIADLIDAVVRSGASRCRLRAKMAGGAAMFAVRNAPQSDLTAIGRRNVQSCRDALSALGVTLVAQDTGGTKGAPFSSTWRRARSQSGCSTGKKK